MYGRNGSSKAAESIVRDDTYNLVLRRTIKWTDATLATTTDARSSIVTDSEDSREKVSLDDNTDGGQTTLTADTTAD